MYASPFSLILMSTRYSCGLRMHERHKKKIGEHFPHKKKIVCVHATEKNDRKKCATCADTSGKSMAFVVQQFQWNIIGTVCNYLFLLCAICSYSLSHAAPIDAIHTYHFWFCR